MEVQEIEAGPETDRLVAEACGVEVHLKVLGVGQHEYRRYTGDTYHDVSFAPSRNWNDAMMAAEECKLFDGWMLGHSSAHSGWYLQNDEEEPLAGEWGLAETGPLAISRAILFLIGG